MWTHYVYVRIRPQLKEALRERSRHRGGGPHAHGPPRRRAFRHPPQQPGRARPERSRTARRHRVVACRGRRVRLRGPGGRAGRQRRPQRPPDGGLPVRDARHHRRPPVRLQPALLAKYELTPQGISAEEIALKWGIGRQEADEFALESQEKAKRARDEGRFDREMMPVDVKLEGLPATIKTDEGIRDTSLEKLASLQPSFREDGVHHAGNSRQITDGAAALLLMAKEKAEELGVRPRARFAGQAVVGSEPVLMLTGPITATPKVLKHAGLELKDIDVIEINEAFAAVVLAWKPEIGPDMSRVNVNGGAIALGHPLGATG